MSKRISSFYIDEFNRFTISISFYLDEILKIENNLDGIVRRNSIVGIAAKVEVHQLMLNKVSDKFILLKKEISEFKEVIKPNGRLLKNDAITKEMEHQVKLLSTSYKNIEQEFTDVKFYCNNFLDEVLKK